MVYRARQEAFDRDVAVKVLSADALTGEAAARFVRECRAVGALSWHPNVVTVHDAGTTANGNGYLVMSWLEGGSLGDELARGPLSPRRTIEIGIAISGALEATHRAGRLHRDVKPDNILIGPVGEPQLADFGIAAVAGHTITVDGQQAFSPSHVPPEVIAGGPVGVACDIYSLASTLYTLLAGRGPFDRESDTSLLPLMARIAADPPPDLRPGVPEPLWRVLEQGLAKEPAARQATAAAFAADLQRAARELGWVVAAPVFGAAGRSTAGETVTGGIPPLLTPAPADANGSTAGGQAAAVGPVDAADERGDNGRAASPDGERLSPGRGVDGGRQWSPLRLAVGAALVAAAVVLAIYGPGLVEGPAQEELANDAAAESDPTPAADTPANVLEQARTPQQVVAGAPRGYQMQPATQQLDDQAAASVDRIDPDGDTIEGVATGQIRNGSQPVALAIAYGLTQAAANPLVVEDRIVGAAMDPGAQRAKGQPPTWRGQVTGNDGQVSAAAVILTGEVALILLASDQNALDDLVSGWRAELR